MIHYTFTHRALDLDDFKNVCGCEEYPLLRTINRVLRKYPATTKKCVLESQHKADEPTEPEKPTKMPTTMTMTTRKPVKETKPATQKPTTRKTTMKPKSTTSRTTSPSYDFGDDELSDEVMSCNADGETFNDNKDCSVYDEFIAA